MARVDVVALAAAAATVAVSVPVPLVNVIDVAVPKFTPSTVGTVVFGAAVAPENVRFLAPPYEVTVLLFASSAVMVIVDAVAPAVVESVLSPPAVIRNRDTAPAVVVTVNVTVSATPLIEAIAVAEVPDVVGIVHAPTLAMPFAFVLAVAMVSLLVR